MRNYVVNSQKSIVNREKLCVDKSESQKPAVNSRQGEKGFTLAEVLIATAILGVMLLLIYSIFIKVYTTGARSQAKVISNNVGQEILENAVNKPYENLAIWAGPGTSVPDTYNVVEKGGATYTEEIVKTDTGDSEDYIPYVETETISGIEFTITTVVTWHDDDKDGKAPSDPNPQDYKRMLIEVTWENKVSAPSTMAIDRFSSFFYRPTSHATGTADGGDIRLTAVGATDYMKLGYSTTETYAGGDESSKAEAKNGSTKNTYGAKNNSSDPVAWAYAYADEDASTPDILDAIEKTDTGSDITDGTITIALPDASLRPAAKTVAGTSDILGKVTYGTWHNGEFGSEDVWDFWGSPPDPDTGNAWTQPSGIAKSFTGVAKWAYTPDINPLNFAEIQSTRTGSKLVTSTASMNNRINLRNWTRSTNLRLIDLNNVDTETLPNDGLVQIDNIQAWTETKADGQINGIAQFDWVITGLRVWNRTTHMYVDYNLEMGGQTQEQIDAIEWPAPIDDDSVEIGTVTTNTDDNNASVNLTILKFDVDQQTIGTINVPKSQFTIGVLGNNVSYTGQ